MERLLGGAPGSFLALDGPELATEPVSSFTALQRSAYLALWESGNWSERPWVYHGRVVGVVRRGELTHDVRSIAERARVSKDVVQGVIEALRAAGLLVWIEPGNEPTTETTIDPTARPTKGPTRPRKLRLVNYRRKAPASDTGPTSEPTREPTTEPTTEPTEIRSEADLQTSRVKQQQPRARTRDAANLGPLGERYRQWAMGYLGRGLPLAKSDGAAVAAELEQILETHGLEAAVEWTKETLLPRLQAGDPGPSSVAYLVRVLRDMARPATPGSARAERSNPRVGVAVPAPASAFGEGEQRVIE